MVWLAKTCEEELSATKTGGKKESAGEHMMWRMEFAEWFLQQYGAVHCSAAFNLTKARTKEQHVKVCMHNNTKGRLYVSERCRPFAPTEYTKRMFCEKVQWNLWSILRRQRIANVKELNDRLTKCMGLFSSEVFHGVTKAYQLFSAEIRCIAEGRDADTLAAIQSGKHAQPKSMPEGKSKKGFISCSLQPL